VTEYRFRKQDRIGYADAESDKDLLAECFIDIGDLAVLRDTANPRRVVLARTGVGKTALLLQLEAQEERVIRIQPEALSLPYISNSTILNHVRSLGADLGLFFKMLWRHVFAVEIIKLNEKIRTEEEKNGWFTRIKAFFSKEPKRLRTIEYMEQFGSNFWEETDVRVKEITSKVERDLKGSFGPDFPKLALHVEGGAATSREERSELLQRSQSVVNKIQAQQLTSILELLDEILTDRQKKYFVVIDRLDEDWVEDALRYELIRALVDTVGDFQKVRSAKIVIALREDLLERVFARTTRPGFQREKVEDLLLRLSWQRPQLEGLLDQRVQAVIRKRYEKSAQVRLRDLMSNVDGQDGVEYLLDRTLFRPRDAIAFLNACLEVVDDNAQFTSTNIKKAERTYSKNRLTALCDEWRDDFPNLRPAIVGLLTGMPRQFKVADLEPHLASYCIGNYGKGPKDGIAKTIDYYMTEDPTFLPSISRMLVILYKVGVIGLKVKTGTRVYWSFLLDAPPDLDTSDITGDVGVTVHFAFCAELRVH
jgi:hypothetical protein